MPDDPGIDPRYAAQFQRGYGEAATDADADAAMDADEVDADETVTWRGRLRPVVLPALGAALILLAVAATAAASVSPTAGPRDPGATLPATAAGPLFAAGVLAVVLSAADARKRHPRAASAVLLATPAVLIGLAGVVGWQLERLAALTAAGPVSSGGIPLPDAAMADYVARVEAAAVLTDLLPWLVFAAAGAVVGGVAAVGRGAVNSPGRAR